MASTYRGVQVDKDGTGNVFAAVGLSEEGLVRTILSEILGFGVGATVRKETVLEEVTESIASAVERSSWEECRSSHVQLPGAVTQLGTSLADVKVADLSRTMLALFASFSRNLDVVWFWICEFFRPSLSPSLSTFCFQDRRGASIIPHALSRREKCKRRLGDGS